MGELATSLIAPLCVIYRREDIWVDVKETQNEAIKEGDLLLFKSRRTGWPNRKWRTDLREWSDVEEINDQSWRSTLDHFFLMTLHNQVLIGR